MNREPELVMGERGSRREREGERWRERGVGVNYWFCCKVQTYGSFRELLTHKTLIQAGLGSALLPQASRGSRPALE